MEDSINLVLIKNGKFWDIEIDGSNKIISKQGEEISIYCPHPCYNVHFDFTSKTNKRTKSVKIECGIPPSPFLTIVGVDKNNTISNLDLDFVKFLGQNDPHSPEIKVFHVTKIRCSYSNKDFWMDGRSLNNHFIHLLNIDKPEFFNVDSVVYEDEKKLIYERSIARKINIKYSSNSFCDKIEKKVYKYIDIENKQKLEIDTNKCNFIYFDDLGSTSTVNIIDNEGNTLFNQSIQFSAVTNKNYFSLNNAPEEIKIIITGDAPGTKIVLIKKLE